MAKKLPAAEFNMSQTIRDLLMENPKLSSQEASDAIMALHPSAAINKEQLFGRVLYRSKETRNSVIGSQNESRQSQSGCFIPPEC